MPCFSASFGVINSESASALAACKDASFVSNCCCRTGPTQPIVIPFPVRRWSALSARNVSRYSAREVNIRYGSVIPRVTRSSIITPR
jgi:hypothetical protein